MDLTDDATYQVFDISRGYPTYSFGSGIEAAVGAARIATDAGRASIVQVVTLLEDGRSKAEPLTTYVVRGSGVLSVRLRLLLLQLTGASRWPGSSRSIRRPGVTTVPTSGTGWCNSSANAGTPRTASRTTRSPVPGLALTN